MDALLVIRRLILVAAALFIGWRALSIGLASHYLDRADAGDTDAVEKAAQWQPGRPEVLVRQALAARPDARDAGALVAAYAANPTDTRTLLAMAADALASGETPRSDALIAQAVTLAPASPELHQRVAAYWVARNKPTQAVREWDLAMRADRRYEKDLFPLLLRVVQAPALLPVLQPLTANPPPWWERFFAEVARQAPDIDTLRTLYAFRKASADAPPSARERRIYVRALRNSGRLAEAYIVWVNGLNRHERESLGWLNNGGFELEPGNSGFDWHLLPGEDVTVRTVTTQRTEGTQSLQMEFSGGREPLRALFQPLFLNPGAYRLSGQLRTKSLRTKADIRWQIVCLKPDAHRLTLSPPIARADEWRKFSFEFRVPQACRGQAVGLTSTAKRSFEYEITGTLWLDEMAIERVREALEDPSTTSAN